MINDLASFLPNIKLIFDSYFILVHLSTLFSLCSQFPQSPVLLSSSHLHCHILDNEQLTSVWLQTSLNWHWHLYSHSECYNQPSRIDPKSYNLSAPLCYSSALSCGHFLPFSHNGSPAGLPKPTFIFIHTISNNATKKIILKAAMSCHFYGKVGNVCLVSILPYKSLHFWCPFSNFIY